MQKYKLKSDFLSYCSGVWNGTEFVDGNSSDCCMNSCKNHINFCFNECLKTNSYSDYKNCADKCFQFVKSCEIGCHKDDNFNLNNELRNTANNLFLDKQQYDKQKKKTVKIKMKFFLAFLTFFVLILIMIFLAIKKLI